MRCASPPATLTGGRQTGREQQYRPVDRETEHSRNGRVHPGDQGACDQRRREERDRSRQDGQETCMPDVDSSETVRRRIRSRLRPIGWFGRDVRVNFRGLRRQQGLVEAVVLPIASAVTITTALFSIVEGLFLRPLPLTAPESLVP
jgi:hypothetical protein